jgi:hypothetical protein
MDRSGDDFMETPDLTKAEPMATIKSKFRICFIQTIQSLEWRFTV